MADALGTIQRLISLDEEVRRHGQLPHARSVLRTLELIIKHRPYHDASVREWVVARASDNNYLIASAVLKTGLALIDERMADDALRVAKAIVSVATEGDPARLGCEDYSHLRELARLMSQPTLMVAHPVTWGRFLIELQSAAVGGHQESKWPRAKKVREHWDAKFRDASSGVVEYTPEYDDPAYSFYEAAGLSPGLRGELSRTVESALRIAASLSGGSAFRVLAQRLIEGGWTLGYCQILAAIYDHVRNQLERGSWQRDEALSISSDPRFERMRGATRFRRLLRREIKDDLDEAEKLATLQCIREHAPNDIIRWNELADLQEWGLLTDGELEVLRRASEEESLYVALDPREAPQAGPALLCSYPRENRLERHWPHAEDVSLLDLLSNADACPESDDERELRSWLLPRMDALRAIVSRPASISTRWFGEVTGWCAGALDGLKRSILARQAESESAVEVEPKLYLAELNELAPWWNERAIECLKHLARDVPESHSKDHTGVLGWSTNDPIYAGLDYLDELLAVRGCPELDDCRRRLGEVVASQWKRWPSFTRATALALLRPFHWASIASLQDVLVSIVEEERQSDILERALHHLLRCRSEGIVTILQRVWKRSGDASDQAETARLIGEVVGNAVMRCCGGNERDPVLAELADWATVLRGDQSADPQAQDALAHGMLWAAKEYLEKEPQLTSRHGAAWLELARWGTGVYLKLTRERERRLNTLRAVMFVLEMAWSAVVRKSLYEGMGDSIERVIREGDVDDYSTLHFELKEELSQRRRDGTGTGSVRVDVALSDSLLLRLCRASAERVAEWRRAGETTRDLAYGACLWGGDTGALVELVFVHARDRELVRRELAPIIDILALAGLTTLATDLRMKIRRR